MRKLITLIFFVILSEISFGQVYTKGDMLIEGYYGGPNLLTTTIRSLYRSNPNFNQQPLKIRSFGPIGGKVEYLLSKRVGIGLNFNYATTSVEGHVNAFPDNIGKRPDTMYNYKGSIPRWRLMPTVTIHLGSRSKLDPYFCIGIGYSNAKLKEESDDPYFIKETISYNFPVLAFRGEFGVRYFFTPTLGVSGQIGISGGPLLGIGVLAKFSN